MSESAFAAEALKPMNDAPRDASWIIIWRSKDGSDVNCHPTAAHYACGDGDGLMPRFDGWFADTGGYGFNEIDLKNAVGWTRSINRAALARGTEPSGFGGGE